MENKEDNKFIYVSEYDNDKLIYEIKSKIDDYNTGIDSRDIEERNDYLYAREILPVLIAEAKARGLDFEELNNAPSL